MKEKDNGKKYKEQYKINMDKWNLCWSFIELPWKAPLCVLDSEVCDNLLLIGFHQVASTVMESTEFNFRIGRVNANPWPF